MKAKDITLAGLMVALSIIILYLTNIIPVITFALLTIASVIIPITILRTNIKTAIFVYITTSLIGFFIVPINYFIMYFIFFGIYGIVKYFIERLRKQPLEIVLKYIFFNIILVIATAILKSLIGNFDVKIPIWEVLILAEVAFYIFDYALTVLISFYIQKFEKIH